MASLFAARRRAGAPAPCCVSRSSTQSRQCLTRPPRVRRGESSRHEDVGAAGQEGHTKGTPTRTAQRCRLWPSCPGDPPRCELTPASCFPRNRPRPRRRPLSSTAAGRCMALRHSPWRAQGAGCVERPSGGGAEQRPPAGRKAAVSHGGLLGSSPWRSRRPRLADFRRPSGRHRSPAAAWLAHWAFGPAVGAGRRVLLPNPIAPRGQPLLPRVSRRPGALAGGGQDHGDCSV